MTLETSPQFSPDKSASESAITSPSHEALSEEFSAVLSKLEPLCLTAAKPVRESLLWFHGHEYDEVNQVWKTKGFDAVLAQWGAERTYAARDLLPASTNNSGPSRDIPMPEASPPKNAAAQGPVHTLISTEFAPETLPDPVQAAYFRARQFGLSAALSEEFRLALEESGFLAKALPKRDSINDIEFKDTQLGELRCWCEWYGPENLYGNGVVLHIAFDLPHASSNSNRQLRCQINERGDAIRSLWDEELLETGYEGHYHGSFSLSSPELRALIPVVAKISEHVAAIPQRVTVGMWLGNSFFV